MQPCHVDRVTCPCFIFLGALVHSAPWPGTCGLVPCPLVGLRGGWGARAMKLKYTLMAYSNRQKRLHTSSDESEANWPRFLVLERLEGTFEQTSLILLHRGITGMAGEPKLLKRIGKSAYLIETYKESHSSSLLKTNKIANIPVKITPHKSLNSSKGIIKNPELKYCTETEIHEELKQYGVTSVKKISIKRDNKTIPTGTHILTFDIPTLPSSVKIASLNIKVETYIPNPLRCFCCQKFGHHQSKCTRKPICPKCGEDGHPEEDCSSPVKCVNCEGAHPAFSRQCPKWQLEKKSRPSNSQTISLFKKHVK